MAGIYIHIPFCRKKCIYCDFYSIGTKGLEDAYIDAVIKECSLRRNELRNSPLKTIYIGGGTPSLLSPEQIGKIVKGIRSIFSLKSLIEFTIEVNPDDVTQEYISSIKELGINRVSMGIQSFVDSELTTINRRHNSLQAISAVDYIKNAGIDNISIDLIYGLPGQSLDSWLYSLSKAIALNVPHISCYSLSYEEGTRLYSLRERGLINECSEDDYISMYEVMVKELRNYGYEHYEVSNFAKNKKYSVHNSNYWNGEIYLGLGAAAHSYDGKSRSYNIANAKQYIDRISSSELACEYENLSEYERYNEYIMIRLRTTWGVDLNELQRLFEDRFHRHFVTSVDKFIKNELMLLNGTNYRLTERGIMVSDMIIRDLMFG